MSVKVGLLNLPRQLKPLRKGILKGWAETLDRGSYIMGPHVKALEAECAKALSVKYALGCNSGTDALVILLRAAGCGPGDEVLVPAFSFFATAEAVSLVGAKPVFCDVRHSDLCLDIQDVKRRITRKTKAVIPVHLFGVPFDTRALRALLAGKAKQKVAIIEDACQAIGARAASGPVGGLGFGAAFSFYPTKNLGAAGDAGLITTDDEAVATACRELRDHGSLKRYYHRVIGYNSRLDELQAVVLRAKLPKLASWNKKRASVAKAYLKGMQGLPLTLPPADARSVWHQFTIRLDASKRDALKAHLESRGIGCAVFYPVPMHLQAPYKAKAPRLPQAERAAHEVLSLPIYAELNAPEIKAVIQGVRSFFKAA